MISDRLGVTMEVEKSKGKREEKDWWKYRKVLGSYLVTLVLSETFHIYSPVGKK